MFNKTIINEGTTRVIPYERTVVEKKAPTDESIRLLNEFHDKSIENILDRMIVENNKFNYKAVIYKDIHTMQRFIQYTFQLNGEEFSGRVVLKDKESKVALIDAIIKDLSNEITAQILRSNIFK